MVDPLAEKFFSVNPYNYTDNNPVNNIDPNGMETYYGQSAQDMYSQIRSSFGPGDDNKFKKTKDGYEKDLDEVRITTKRWTAAERREYRSIRGLPLNIFSGTGKTDHEAQALQDAYSQNAGWGTDNPLQEGIFDAIMWADGAEGFYLLGRYAVKGSITLAAKYSLKQAIKNPVFVGKELYAFENATTNGVKALMQGKAIDRSFRIITKENYIFKAATKLDLLKVNPLNRGADVVGTKLLKGLWWDVTTVGDWQLHVNKYGSGGNGLFY